MVKLLSDPRPWVVNFKGKHPRAYGILYQATLYWVILQCAIAMTRYLPPNSFPPKTENPVGNATNLTVERICEWGEAREEVEMGSSGPYLFPHFILCPSTFTVTMSTIIFFVAIIHLQYLNRADTWQGYMMFNGILSGTLGEIVRKGWDHILVSIQVSLPVTIWTMSWLSALIHQFWRWAFPGNYARIAETQRMQREGHRGEVDVESGASREGEGVLLAGVDESTPLTGQESVRMRDEAHIELPHVAHTGV